MEEGKQPQARCWFSRRQVREKSGWTEFQTRIHLQRLEDLEYLARRFGRQGVNCVYELLPSVEAPEETARVQLIDVADLARKYGYDRSFEGIGANFVNGSCAIPHEAGTKQPSASAGVSA